MLNKTQATIKGILELYRFKAKQTIECFELCKKAQQGSSDEHVYLEKLIRYLIPELDRHATIIYGLIITYNTNPSYFPSLTKEDILEIQLTQDEITNGLRNAGITINFVRN